MSHYEEINQWQHHTSAVQFNDSTGTLFKAVEVGQGCLLSPTFSNIFLERILWVLGSAIIEGQLIINFCFVDDIENEEEEEEADLLLNRLDTTTTRLYTWKKSDFLKRLHFETKKMFSEIPILLRFLL